MVHFKKLNDFNFIEDSEELVKRLKIEEWNKEAVMNPEPYLVHEKNVNQIESF
jgi:hypothetical protein